MSDDFSQRLLERIEHEHIRPLPRWVVLARHGLLWFLLGLCVICAAFLGSLLFLALFQVDLQFLRASSLGPMLRLLLEYIPMVWIGLFFFFCAIEFFIIRRQTRAYRYPTVLIAAMIVLGVSLGGLGLYAARLPDRIEQSFSRHLPPPMRPFFERGRPVPRPEDGVLVGRIQLVTNDTLTLIDPRGNLWQVRFKESEARRWSFLRSDETILVQGRIVGDRIFQAQDIHPHRPPAGRPPVRSS